LADGPGTAAEKAKSLDLSRVERHIFLCADADKPKLQRYTVFVDEFIEP